MLFPSLGTWQGIQDLPCNPHLKGLGEQVIPRACYPHRRWQRSNAGLVQQLIDQTRPGYERERPTLRPDFQTIQPSHPRSRPSIPLQGSTILRLHSPGRYGLQRQLPGRGRARLKDTARPRPPPPTTSAGARALPVDILRQCFGCPHVAVVHTGTRVGPGQRGFAVR